MRARKTIVGTVASVTVVAGAMWVAATGLPGRDRDHTDDRHRRPEHPMATTKTVDFDGGFVARSKVHRIGTRPIDPATVGTPGAPDRGTPSPSPANADRRYVAVVGMTGCRAPTGAVLHRRGTGLTVEFTGGEDHPECYRADTPFVQFEVAAADVRGVTTIDGVPAQTDG
jgi:hypothetical protein